jgi:hypothetical protein
MKRIKSLEVTTFRGERYLRVWQYAARGGKSLAVQVRVPVGVRPSEMLTVSIVADVLQEEFGV